MARKISSNKRIALIHFLVGGFTIPFVIDAIIVFSQFGYRINSILGWMQDAGGIFTILLYLLNIIIFNILPILIGVFFSIKVLGKKFLDGKSSIVNLSTKYFALFIICLIVLQLLMPMFMPLPFIYFSTLYISAFSIATQNFNFLSGIFFPCFVSILTFYIFGRKYSKAFRERVPH